MSDRVYIRHLRHHGHCAAGARSWFATHGLDWSDFLENGLPVETFEKTDALGREVARTARSEDTADG